MAGTCQRMDKLTKYIRAAFRISRARGIPSPVVLFKVIVAYVVHSLDIRLFELYGLAEKPLGSFGEFMRMSELQSLQRQINRSQEGRAIADSKLRFYLWCTDQGIPTPDVFGCCASDEPANCNGVPLIRDEQQLFDLLERAAVDTFLLKRDYGWHGAGLIRLRHTAAGLFDDRGRGVDATDLLHRLRQADSPYLLQAALRPHPDLRPIMPGPSLGTVRIVTFNTCGRVSLAIACLRVPVGMNVADNFDRGRSGNLLADMNVQTGEIGRCLVSSKGIANSLKVCRMHPETGAEIAGYHFPHWEEVTRLVADAARRLHDMPTIGWDAALTEDGPSLLEANWRYDIEFMQVLADRGLRPDLAQRLASLRDSA